MAHEGTSLLSLDIGSSSCKAVMFDAVGNVLATGKAAYPQYSKRQGWVEQDPKEIWEGVCKALVELRSSAARPPDIAAVSISSQISSYFLVDDQGHALTNVISWADSRSNAEAEAMKEAFSTDKLIELLGVDIPVGPAWIIPKLRWLSNNRPELVARARYMIQLKEWVIWNLTGEWKSDITSCKGIVHQATNEVAEELVIWAGGRPDMIPPRGLPHDIAGKLKPEVALDLGLPSGIPVILGWNDMSAAVLGMLGLTDERVGFDLTGTSEHMGLFQGIEHSVNPASDRGIIKMPYGDKHHVYYGVTFSGGQALKWFVEQIDQPGSALSMDGPDYASVLEQANRVSPGADGALFLPYIHGERSPWWNPAARGVFFGLHATHHRGHMARAVLEGVGFALKSIADHLPILPDQVVASGGSSRIPLWNQIKADIIGRPYMRLETTEAGCLGAAMLAAYALGWYGSLKEAGARMIRTGEVFEPREQYRALYEEKYRTFLSLYRALEPVF